MKNYLDVAINFLLAFLMLNFGILTRIIVLILATIRSDIADVSFKNLLKYSNIILSIPDKKINLF